MLNDEDNSIISRMDDLLREVIRHWHTVRVPGPAHMATGLLLLRASGAWRSMCSLLGAFKDVETLQLCGNDAATILRSLHDFCLQAEYIHKGDLVDNISPDELGKLYLDYEHIERYKQFKASVSGKSFLSKQLADLPNREALEQHFKAEYDRVSPQFKDRKGSIRTHWYRTSLADVANRVDRKDEHIFYTTLMHSSVHGGPLANKEGPAIQSESDFLTSAMGIVGRTLKTVVDLHDLRLTPPSKEMLEGISLDPLNP